MPRSRASCTPASRTPAGPGSWRAPTTPAPIPCRPGRRVAFAAVVARRDMRTGVVVGEGERLTRAQALAALTAGGAWVTFAERTRGRLAPGFAADLAVLEHDPLTAPLEALVGQTARL